MIEIEDLDDAYQVLAWFQHPAPKPTLALHLAEALERWRQADSWMREHMSVKIVWPMLCTKYGYSESTARRDIEACQVIFGEFKVHKKAYYAGLMLDTLCESFLKAQHDRKYGECARLAKVILEYLEVIDKATDVDPKDLLKPTTIVQIWDPKLLGVPEIENLELKIEAIKAKKKDRGTPHHDSDAERAE